VPEQLVPETLSLILYVGPPYLPELPPAGGGSLELDLPGHGHSLSSGSRLRLITDMSFLTDRTAEVARFVDGTEPPPHELSDCRDRRAELRSNDTRLLPVSQVLPAARRAYIG